MLVKTPIFLLGLAGFLLMDLTPGMGLVKAKQSKAKLIVGTRWRGDLLNRRRSLSVIVRCRSRTGGASRLRLQGRRWARTRPGPQQQQTTETVVNKTLTTTTTATKTTNKTPPPVYKQIHN